MTEVKDWRWRIGVGATLYDRVFTSLSDAIAYAKRVVIDNPNQCVSIYFLQMEISAAVTPKLELFGEVGARREV
jgi:hypothetical protein